jgi:t-SNARE complex subunit (syntaxin)
MQMMVEQQAETLTQIEHHAENTMVDLEVGNKDIDRAIVSAKSTRAVSCLLIDKFRSKN